LITSPGTNPEKLAAAHAACNSLAVSLGLTEVGHTLRTIETQAQVATRAQVDLRNVGGLPTMRRTDLDTEADVPDFDQAGFQSAGVAVAPMRWRSAPGPGSGRMPLRSPYPSDGKEKWT
jgi:organic hydroperoxide reductase OsmC/OhrA